MLEKDAISHVIFDVDGTMYRKNIEYNPQTGTIQTAHDFFRYLLHIMLKQGVDPEEIPLILVPEYKTRISEGTLKQKVQEIPTSAKEELDELIKEYSSNGNVFGQWHRLRERGLPNLLHKMLAEIDFSQTLARDERLLEVFSYLRSQEYGLGIITSEVYGTVEVIASTLDFNIADFQLGNDPRHSDFYSESDQRFYPILCRNNCRPKPDPEGFRKVARILEVDEPRSLLYVGDRIKNDIVPSLSCGWQAVLVTGNDNGISSQNICIDGQEHVYTTIGSVCDLSKII